MVVQSHLSASVIIIITISVMMIMAGCKVSHFAIFGSIGAGVGLSGMYILAKFFKMGSFRLSRIYSFVNPWLDPQETDGR